jgi:hypothetical protein
VRPLVLTLLLSIAALPAEAQTHGGVSEGFTAGSGPYIGNSLSAGISQGIFDVDAGYDFGSDKDLVLFHSLWASVGVWPVYGLRFRVDGSFGPRTSTTSTDRGFFSLGSAGVGATITWHPGHSGHVRPYFEVGASYDEFNIAQSRDPPATDTIVDATFSQEAIRGTVGLDVNDTALRLGASKFFYSADASAVDLPPGIGGGPSTLGAVSGALPTRAEDWNVRGSVRQVFGGGGDWSAQVGLSYGPYLDDDGSIAALSLRLSHDLSRALSANLGVTGQMETLAQTAGTSTRLGLFATVGLSVHF